MCTSVTVPLVIYPGVETGEKGRLFHGVGGQDGFGNLLKVIRLGTDGFRKFRQRGDEFFRRQRNADNSGGRRKDFFRFACERLGGRLAGGAGSIDAGLSDSAVGVAGIDGDHADPAARCEKMFRVNEQRRGLDAIACECGGGSCGRVCNNQREVGAAALLQAGLGRSEAKTAGNHKLREIAHRYFLTGASHVG